LKKPTGSVRFQFYKLTTEKTEPKQKKTGKKTEPNQKKKPSQTEKTESNQKNRAKPI
jgi:hypothetical protein